MSWAAQLLGERALKGDFAMSEAEPSSPPAGRAPTAVQQLRREAKARQEAERAKADAMAEKYMHGVPSPR